MRTATSAGIGLILISLLAVPACGSATTTEAGGGGVATTTIDPGPVTPNGLTCTEFFGMAVDYSTGNGSATPEEALANLLSSSGKSVSPPLPVDGYIPEAVGPPPATVGAAETVLMVHSTNGQPDVSVGVTNYGQGWVADTLSACGSHHTGGLPTGTTP